MKRLLETIRSARWLEAALLIALICVMAVCLMKQPQNGSATDTEKRMERILSAIDGAGRVRVMISETDTGIEGVVAACGGADDLQVALTLQSAISTLTGVDCGRIEIVHAED